MLIGTWESLKVTEPRKLLGGVAVDGLIGAGFFDVYDVSDCAHPVQLNGLAGSSLELPDNVLGHEGNWSPDGKTFWATGTAAGSITAIDVSNPASPQDLYKIGRPSVMENLCHYVNIYVVHRHYKKKKK